MDDLSTRLHDAVDDHPLPPPDLAPLARRQRHARQAIVGAVSAVVLIAGVGGLAQSVRLPIPQTAAPAATASAEPTPTPSIPTQSSDSHEQPQVGPADIIERCGPQIAQYSDYPMYPQHPTHWVVPHPHVYRVGEIVALYDTVEKGNVVLCRIPAAGHENDPVSLSTFDANPDDASQIRQLCNERLRWSSRDQSLADFDTPDIRGGRVAAIARAGKVVQAVIVADDKGYQCSLPPMTWDAPAEVGPEPAAGEISWSSVVTGPTGKSVVKDPGLYVYGSARHPKAAGGTASVSVGDESSRFPVSADGRWAFALKAEPTGAPPVVRYVVKDASGTVVARGES